MRDALSKEVIPFFCEKLKQHEETIDPESPRDYMDYLILEARENEDIGVVYKVAQKRLIEKLQSYPHPYRLTHRPLGTK